MNRDLYAGLKIIDITVYVFMENVAINVSIVSMQQIKDQKMEYPVSLDNLIIAFMTIPETLGYTVRSPCLNVEPKK